jgi:hypothetical protein
MSKLPLSAAVLLLASPVGAALAPGASARVNATVAGAGYSVLGAWTAGGFDALPAAPLAHARVMRAKGDQPLITHAMWDAAKPLDAATARWIAGRVPGMDASKVREASYEQVSAVVAECVRRGYSNLDLFTDPGLRGDVAYYLSSATMARLYRDFNLAASLQYSGKTSDGDDYRMDGIVMGRGAVNILYNYDGFQFDANGKTYKASGRIVQSIQGNGVVGVSGLWVHVSLFWPQIQKLSKLGGGKMRVDTNMGSRDMDDNPITRR